MECRCADTSLTELSGDDALEYAAHLKRVAEEKGQWLLRCPTTASEWVEDFPLDPRNREWVGVCRLRRFPLRAA
jgi:hypothetical protein